jgi:hypothetical protein
MHAKAPLFHERSYDLDLLVGGAHASLHGLYGVTTLCYDKGRSPAGSTPLPPQWHQISCRPRPWSTRSYMTCSHGSMTSCNRPAMPQWTRYRSPLHQSLTQAQVLAVLLKEAGITDPPPLPLECFIGSTKFNYVQQRPSSLSITRFGLRKLE